MNGKLVSVQKPVVVTNVIVNRYSPRQGHGIYEKLQYEVARQYCQYKSLQLNIKGWKGIIFLHYTTY